jgi:GT2 family glycosyltransferase
MTLISVIIPTCHRNEALMKCLASIAPAKQEELNLFDRKSANPDRESANAYEVIVTDDGSVSTAEILLRDKFPWALWVVGPKRGPAANRNYGADKAWGDWLVFVDDDCVPDPTYLAAYAHAASAENCAVLEGMTAAQGKRKAADMECPINTTGGHLWSCNFAIKRRLFIELGGFDENFPVPAMEDIDMQARLSKAGYKTIFVSEASVKHPWRPRKGVNFLRFQARSVAYYLNKHPEYRRCFSLTSLAKRAVSAALRDYPKNLVAYRGKGALRTLTLDLVLVSFLFKYLTEQGCQFRNRILQTFEDFGSMRFGNEEKRKRKS